MGFIDWIAGFYTSIRNSVPEGYRILVDLTLYTLFIALYAVFIWKFYKFLARREIIKLNLSKYNHSQYPGLEKFFAVILYTVEYLIILPFLVLFWFGILSLFLLLLSEAGAALTLLASAAIIASTRITAYISEDLSKDLAKILPFTVLATYLLNPDFFDIANLILKFKEVPSLFNNVVMFIIFIFGIEFLLRVIYSIVQLIHSSSQEEIDDEEIEETEEVDE